MRINKHHQGSIACSGWANYKGPKGSKKRLMMGWFGVAEDQIRAELHGPLQRASEVGLSIIICFRKAQDEPYRCYEDFVLHNRSQQAQIQPSSLLCEDLSWGVRISAYFLIKSWLWCEIEARVGGFRILAYFLFLIISQINSWFVSQTKSTSC